MGKDDDSSTSENGAVPKLTVGQRVLTALPNLQRQPKARPETPTRRAAGRPGTAAAEAGAGEVLEPDAVLAPGSSAPAPSGRLRDSFVKPAAPRQPRGVPSGKSKEELTDIIKRLDDRERFLALVSAPLGVVVGLLLTIGALHYNPAPHHKGHLSTGLILFEGGARVLLSGVLVLAVWSRRRSFVAFALLFLGTSMAFPFALPFWALGIWLIFRVFKYQKELGTVTGGQRRGRPEPRPRGGSDTAARRRADVEARRRARADRLSARAGGRGAKNKRQPEPPGPPPSKRYTPPKTIRPKPPVP